MAAPKTRVDCDVEVYAISQPEERTEHAGKSSNAPLVWEKGLEFGDTTSVICGSDFRKSFYSLRRKTLQISTTHIFSAGYFCYLGEPQPISIGASLLGGQIYQNIYTPLTYILSRHSVSCMIGA